MDNPASLKKDSFSAEQFNVLRVAWWTPINYGATPHNVALTFPFLGLCFYHFQKVVFLNIIKEKKWSMVQMRK